MILRTNVRLGSLLPNGLGGPKANSISIIYSFLLQKFNQAAYRQIWINQIGGDLEETIVKSSKGEIFINIRYKPSEPTTSLDRLNLIHESLLRISMYEHRLDPECLHNIKRSIIDNKFLFKFICKEYGSNGKGEKAFLIVEPNEDLFKYFIRVQSKEFLTEQLIYLGRPEILYVPGLFGKCIWKQEGKLVLTGSEKDMEMWVDYVGKKIEIINLTKYNNPPYYQMMRADISQELRESASLDWKHSLPPHVSALMDQREN
jgi:hypothetical protein